MMSKSVYMKKLTIIIAAMALLVGCASTGELNQLRAENASLRADKTRYYSRINELEASIAELKNNISGLTDKIAMLKNDNTALTQQTADQQTKLNQNQVLLQVDQDRLDRMEKLLVIERAKSEDKSKAGQPNNVVAN